MKRSTAAAVAFALVTAAVIVPIVNQPALVPGGTPTSGVSDILCSAFFSPKEGGVLWGVGPVLLLPTTADATLGTEQWGAGPTFVVLKGRSGRSGARSSSSSRRGESPDPDPYLSAPALGRRVQLDGLDVVDFDRGQRSP